MSSSPKFVKREQPRNVKGEFASLPPKIPVASIVRSTIDSEAKLSKENDHDDILKIYTKFKENYGRAPIIGLDLDGTTANMVHGLRAHVAKNKGMTPAEAEAKLPEPGEYDFVTGETAWFSDRKEFLEHFLSAEKAGMYRDLPAYTGSFEVLQILAKEGFEIKAVTARSADFNPDTAHWLANNGLPKIQIFNPGTEKHTLEDIDIFIDDAPHVINKLVEKGRKVIIFDQAYNGFQVTAPATHTRRIAGWTLSGVASALRDLL